MDYRRIHALPAVGLWIALLGIIASCNLPLSLRSAPSETEMARQRATETAQALETQIAATVMSEITLTAAAADQTSSPSPPPEATATATTTPTATPTPTASATPTPTSTWTPAPVEINLDTASSGDGRVSGRNTGILGIVLADAVYGYNTGNGRIQVSAAIPTAGSFEDPTATGWLDRPFTVPSSLGSSVQLQLSGEVDWRGVLAGNGVAGAGAEVTITLKLLDGSRVITQSQVHSKEVREAALSVGGLTDNGSASPSLSATLVGGRRYTLRLEATCNATSGLVSASTHCVFGPSDLYAEGYVHWGGFTATLIP